jgi:hypothetical protein
LSLLAFCIRSQDWEDTWGPKGAGVSDFNDDLLEALIDERFSDLATVSQPGIVDGLPM